MINKSLKKNALYYGGKTVVSIIFPLITYKYASYVLGVGNVGKIEFTKSFVSYFLLFANLGINSYAIRTGAGLREDKSRLQEFACKVFGINCVSALAAIIVFIGFSIFSKENIIDLTVGYIFLAQIPLNLIGVDWIFNIYEEFKYITYRSLICQLIALGFMFAFVRTSDQFVYYAIALVIASHGAYVFNWIRANQIIKIRPILNKKVLQLLVPILIIFSNIVAQSIYVNLDVSMLGIIKGEYDVGIYSAAVKVYTAIKSLIYTVLLVALPRISYYLQNDLEKSFCRTESKIINLMIVVVPVFMIGTILQSKNLILVVSGTAFIKANLSLSVLGAAIVFSAVGMTCANTILLPDNKEKNILISTTSGAIANFLLNLVFIPTFGIVGAAVTTLISEIIVSSIQIIESKSMLVKIKLDIKRSLLPSIMGVFSILIINIIVNHFVSNYLVCIMVAVVISFVVYCSILIIFKNEFALRFINKLQQR